MSRLSRKVYLDACCLNRLTDDQTQPRIRQEAEAVELIFKRIRDRSIQWVSSEALVEEIDKNPAADRRSQNLALLLHASQTVEVHDDIADRARQLQAAGYGPFDALHLACAEAARATVLLTTDDGFIKKADRGVGSPRVAVRNPVSWGQEALP